MVVRGPEGLPFFDDDNPYEPLADAIDILAGVMNNNVVFFRMTPADSLLSGVDSRRVWCLAEAGRQYLVFATGGDPFNLQVAAGQYGNIRWIDAKTGEMTDADHVGQVSAGPRSFVPPSTTTDWVLILTP